MRRARSLMSWSSWSRRGYDGANKKQGVDKDVGKKEDKGDKDKGDKDKGDKDKGDKEKGDKDKGVMDKGRNDEGKNDKGKNDKGKNDKGKDDKGKDDKGKDDKGKDDKAKKGKKGCPVCPPEEPKEGSSCESFLRDAQKHAETREKCKKNNCPYGDRCCNKDGDCIKNIRAICEKDKTWSIEKRCGYTMCGHYEKGKYQNYEYQKVCAKGKIHDKCQAEKAGYEFKPSDVFTPTESKTVRYEEPC